MKHKIRAILRKYHDRTSDCRGDSYDSGSSTCLACWWVASECDFEEMSMELIDVIAGVKLSTLMLPPSLEECGEWVRNWTILGDLPEVDAVAVALYEWLATGRPRK